MENNLIWISSSFLWQAASTIVFAHKGALSYGTTQLRQLNTVEAWTTCKPLLAWIICDYLFNFLIWINIRYNDRLDDYSWSCGTYIHIQYVCVCVCVCMFVCVPPPRSPLCGVTIWIWSMLGPGKYCKNNLSNDSGVCCNGFLLEWSNNSQDRDIQWFLMSKSLHHFQQRAACQELVYIYIETKLYRE